MKFQKQILAAITFIGFSFFSVLMSLGQTPGSYEPTRELLSKMKDQNVNDDKLAKLFKTEDKKINELVELLYDRDGDISLCSQIVLRYLGNEEGMKGLFEWYSKQQRFQVAGPIPLPLREWDFNVVYAQYINEPRGNWTKAESYIYALALDENPKSAIVLEELIKNAGSVDDLSAVDFAIKNIKSTQFVRSFKSDSKNIAARVLRNAFFIASEDKKFTSAKLLSLNNSKDKALVKIYTNRGTLSEEFYHIVVKKAGNNTWKFFSITQVAIS